MKFLYKSFLVWAILGTFLINIYTNLQAQPRYRKAAPKIGYQKPSLTAKPSSKKAKNPPIDIKSLTELDTHLEQGKPVVIMIHADWCGACKISMDPFAQAAEENPNITFLKIEGSTEVPGITKKYSLRGFPTTVLLDAQGKEVHKFSGGGWPTSILNQKIKDYIK